jgi:hypothetical protein
MALTAVSFASSDPGDCRQGAGLRLYLLLPALVIRWG